jgi:hypothetical protein
MCLFLIGLVPFWHISLDVSDSVVPESAPLSVGDRIGTKLLGLLNRYDICFYQIEAVSLRLKKRDRESYRKKTRKTRVSGLFVATSFVTSVNSARAPLETRIPIGCNWIGDLSRNSIETGTTRAGIKSMKTLQSLCALKGITFGILHLMLHSVDCIALVQVQDCIASRPVQTRVAQSIIS